MVKEIPLQNGMVALVDDEDFERCIKQTWYVRMKNTRVFIRSDKLKMMLSNYVLGEVDTKNEVVVYKDGNSLNNQKSNLFKVPRKFMHAFRRGNVNSTSKYKGVSLVKTTGKYVAQIMVNRQQIRLGSFTKEEEAAKVYNKAALEYFGEYAYQNIIGEDNNAIRVVEVVVK